MPHRKKSSLPLWRLFIFAVILLFAGTVISQGGMFYHSLQQLARVDLRWVAGAVGLSVIAYYLTAWLYCLVAKHPIRLGVTVIVQLVGAFANRLLPAGGAVGVSYYYLYKHQHSAEESTAVVVVKNALNIVGHLLLLGLLVVAGQITVPGVPRQYRYVIWIVTVLLVIIAALVVVFGQRLFRRVEQFIARTWRQIASYRHRVGGLWIGLAAAVLYTICSVLILGMSAASVGVWLTFGQLFMLLTFGIIGTAITPTPGGIGGSEVTLFVAMTLAGVSSSQALLIVVVYRFLTYWLPLLAGALALGYAQKRQYI